MRAFSYACSLPVTRQRWRSHHSVRRSRKSIYCTQMMALSFIEQLVIGYQSLQCWTYFWLFCLLWPWSWSGGWPSLYELHGNPWRQTECAKMNVVRQGFRKLGGECVHVVTHHFRSRDKDCGAVPPFDRPLSKTPRYTQIWLSFIEPELWAIEVYIAGIGILDFSAPVTLSLTWWPSYTNLTRIAWSYAGYRMCKYELPKSRLSKVIVYNLHMHTYIQTEERQTESTEIKVIKHAALRVLSNSSNLNN